MTTTTLEADYARERLLEYYLKAGDTVYIHCDKVTPSATRYVSAFIVDESHAIVNVSGYIAEAAGYRLSKDGEIILPFVNMDADFYLVYTLSLALFKDGYALTHRRA